MVRLGKHTCSHFFCVPCWEKLEVEIASSNDALRQCPSLGNPCETIVKLGTRVPPPPRSTSRAREYATRLPPIPPRRPTRRKLDWQSQSESRSESTSVGVIPYFDPDVIRTGIIRMIDANRGYGFISRDDGNGSIWFHVSCFKLRPSRVGAAVEFREALNPKKNSLKAVDILEISNVNADMALNRPRHRSPCSHSSARSRSDCRSDSSSVWSATSYGRSRSPFSERSNFSEDGT